MSVLLFRAVLDNPRQHPVSLGLLYLYCPAAAYWWRVGVEIEPPFDPVWQAVEDYTAQPKRTLREYLEERGLGSLIDEARKYIEQVTVSRQRLPHISAPELLPTFPGGRLPMSARFGVQEALKAIGGEKGFFAYVRVWAFLVSDWKAQFPHNNLEIFPLQTAVRFDGLRSAYRLPAWAFFTKTKTNSHTPLILGIPPDTHGFTAIKALAALYLFAQSASDTPWEHEPQVWHLQLDGTAAPVDIKVPPENMAQAILTLGERVTNATGPYPLMSLVSPKQCDLCPFRHLCYVEEKGRRSWTPQVLNAAVKGARK